MRSPEKMSATNRSSKGGKVKIKPRKSSREPEPRKDQCLARLGELEGPEKVAAKSKKVPADREDVGDKTGKVAAVQG